MGMQRKKVSGARFRRALNAVPEVCSSGGSDCSRRILRSVTTVVGFDRCVQKRWKQETRSGQGGGELGNGSPDKMWRGARDGDGEVRRVTHWGWRTGS